MKRRDILAEFPDEYSEQVNKIIDYFETQFTEIRWLLTITILCGLEGVKLAYDFVNPILDDLY